MNGARASVWAVPANSSVQVGRTQAPGPRASPAGGLLPHDIQGDCFPGATLCEAERGPGGPVGVSLSITRGALQRVLPRVPLLCCLVLCSLRAKNATPYLAVKLVHIKEPCRMHTADILHLKGPYNTSFNFFLKSQHIRYFD